MHILFVAATIHESEILINAFPFKKNGNVFSYQTQNHSVDVLITSVGSVNTTYHLQQYLQQNKPEVVIQYGIAGIKQNFIELGNCFIITDDCFADVGVFEYNKYKNLYDMNLADVNEKPFLQKKLSNTSIVNLILPDLQKASSRSVNLIEGDSQRLQIMNEKYDTDAESMEGAAFHFVMLQTNIPFLQIRSASNIIGERDKSKWKMKLAIDKINEVVLKIIELNISLS
ncbi:MAG: futalosine hydrolase [Bacteroidota bacterium]|jgi:futalosine hydrolase